MVGGGIGSMIGDIHRCALNLDNKYELICGAFSANALKSQELGKTLGLDPNRVYSSYEEMFANELTLSQDKRIEVVSILTPNHLHFDVAKIALHSDFHVIMEKPITKTLEETHLLEKIVKQTKKLFCIAYTFAGYPMVKEARSVIQSRKLGRVRKVVVEFSQGWLTSYLEGQQQNKPAGALIL